MKSRNLLNIFLLCCVFGLFLAFGAVANAEESGETETFTYSLSYEVPNSYTSNFIDTAFWDYGSFSLDYRLVILHHPDADVDVITSPDPDKVVVVSKNYNFYRLGNDGSLTSISSSGVSVSYTLRRVRRSNNKAETVSGTNKLQSFFASSISTDIPIYEADEAGQAAALEYLKTGKLPEASYNDKIETPKLSFTSELKFYISNASDNYYIEMQGRNYTVDDIELYKDGVVWKYKYSTILKNDLSTWVDVNSRIQSAGEHSLFVYGKSSVSDLLSKYPIDSRTYYGGTNAIGNYFSGYSDALSQLKSLLSYHGSLYLGSEIYVRFYVIDDSGNIEYGKWCHWFDNLAKAGGSSGSRIDDGDNIDTGNQSDVGLTDKDKNKLEDSGKPKTDPDAKPDKDYITSTNLWSYMDSLVKNLGDFPTLIASVFTFFPAWLTNLIFIVQ